MSTTMHNMLLCILVVIFSYRVDAQSALPFRETYKEACIARLSEAIQIKTISAETNISFDTSAFTALRLFMEKISR
ncbi:MAG: hypothetical protein HC867_04480 [Bacteroidia bacterium]|nr:hypothetical protein [Bacteroidia bacterium]